MPNTEPSLNVIIDHVTPTEIPADLGIFELSTLMSLEMGLNHIALTVWRKEEPLRGNNSARTRPTHPGTDPRESRLLESHFHWFGMSLCNYVSLVGFLASLYSGTVSRKDLEHKRGQKRIASACKAYVNGIPEIREILVWRKKVAGHYAITELGDDDIVGTRDMTPLHPVSSVTRRYRVSQWDEGKHKRGVRHDGFPTWSITEVYERLAPRYWPSFRWPKGETQSPDRLPSRRP